jgi:hypothetical protein
MLLLKVMVENCRLTSFINQQTQRDIGLHMTLHSTCFLKMAYYESTMFNKVSKHWRNN